MIEKILSAGFMIFITIVVLYLVIKELILDNKKWEEKKEEEVF